MSRLPSIVTVATAKTRHYVTKAPHAEQAFNPSQLLSFHYLPFPSSPINSTTLFPTASFWHDASHPFHIRTQRRLAAYDATDRLHWRVQCPVDVSRKAFIRNWAAKRVRNAFAKELNGERPNKSDSATVGGRRDDPSHVTGALLIVLAKNKIALTASKETVRASAAWLLERITRMHKAAVEEGRALRNGNTRTTTRTHDTATTFPAAALSPSYLSTPSLLRPSSTASSSTAEEIRAQVEYYFSNANLPRDRFLLSLTEGPANKPVSLKTLHSFKRMRRFRSYEAVREAVRDSDMLVLDESDGVKRRVALSAALLSNEDGMNKG